MKIQDGHLSGLNGPGVGGAERARQTEAADGTGPARSELHSPDGDRVQLSILSNALRADVEDTPERLERVNQLREAYQNGTYQSDSGLISKRLIDEASGGLG